MELSADLIGTDPKYPKIVNQGWLDVKQAEYDNYPSDNNSVRVQPKLSQMWNHEDTGVTLIPNSTVLPLGIRAADQDKKDIKDTEKAVKDIEMEAKKAIMAGLKGKDLSAHLKARFAPKHIKAAMTGLKKISEEIGLLGTVYVDASAFADYNDADQFFKQNRNRLAQAILFNGDVSNPALVSMIASKFRKNVVASIDYNESTFNKYKAFLVNAGRIPADTLIDSKESLRSAFLYEKQAEIQPVVKKAAQEPKLDEAVMLKSLSDRSKDKDMKNKEAHEIFLIKTAGPIVALVQEGLSKGKDSQYLKQLVKEKFAMTDIKEAASTLAIALSEKGLTEEHISELVTAGTITNVLGYELKKLGKKFPVKKSAFSNVKAPEKTVGVQGYLYSPAVSHKSEAEEVFAKENLDQHLAKIISGGAWDSNRNASAEAFMKGISPERIKEKLMAKMSADEADKVIADAMHLTNSISAGTVANKKVASRKPYTVTASLESALPSSDMVVPQVKDMASFFAGSELLVDVSPASNMRPLDMDGLTNRHGVDAAV